MTDLALALPAQLCEDTETLAALLALPADRADVLRKLILSAFVAGALAGADASAADLMALTVLLTAAST